MLLETKKVSNPRIMSCFLINNSVSLGSVYIFLLCAEKGIYLELQSLIQTIDVVM